MTQQQTKERTPERREAPPVDATDAKARTDEQQEQLEDADALLAEIDTLLEEEAHARDETSRRELEATTVKEILAFIAQLRERQEENYRYVEWPCGC